MARYRILYWRDLPSLVEAGDGAGTVSRQLDERFQALIDSTAMRLGLSGGDAYLEGWHHGDEVERPGDAREVAEAVAAEVESRFEEFLARGLGRG